MNIRIYPRSPREVMQGWAYLPRYIDKIRLHLAGQLHPDYQENFGRGFDAKWLAAAGLTHDQMIAVVADSTTDGQVCDWVRKNVRRTDSEKAAHRSAILDYPPPDDQPMQDRLRHRKEQSGFAHRDDIRTFVDYIDADEERL
jgi:hypothetical protein